MATSGSSGFLYFLDLTEVRDTQEKLRLSLEHLEIIKNQSSSNVIFEWDLVADEITVSPNWLGKFTMRPHYDARLKKEELCAISILMIWNPWLC